MDFHLDGTCKYFVFNDVKLCFGNFDDGKLFLITDVDSLVELRRCLDLY